MSILSSSSSSSSTDDPAIRARIKKRPAAVIPLGSTEQHGAHLPVSTDAGIAAAISERVAESSGYILMPGIHYGVSYEHAPRFHASIKPATLKSTIHEIASSLSDAGIRALFVINAHHGNQRALSRLDRRAGRCRIFALSYWHYTPWDTDHAGEIETSLMLAISRDVDMSRAVRGFVPPVDISKTELGRIKRRASRSFLDVAKDGVWGDPGRAGRRRGRTMLAEAADAVAAECRRLEGGGRRGAKQ